MRMQAVVVSLLAAGCTGDAAEFLTGFEVQELEQHLTTAVESQHAAASFAYAVGRGEEDLTGASYDPPTAGNGWVGTILFPAGTAFPFGTGALSFVFTATADGTPVDPYDPGVDMSAADTVFVDGVLDFDGVSPTALPLQILADLALTSVSNQPDTAVVDLAGTVEVDVDGFATTLEVSDLTATLDLLQGTVTDLHGQGQGTVDLPDRPFDAVFDLDALGTAIDVAVQAASSLFGFQVTL